ncbi:MAG: FMN-binding negative transcriptional regulator [Alphaproteobacteria bacterium]|nr:FMN-binding negative transcriptional regulator [Alphaproteobacteria bacterium]
MLIEAMREIRLAAVFTGEGGLACTQVPMVVDETADGALRLRGYLARANPHWRAIGAGIPALALFQGSHAYVSRPAGTRPSGRPARRFPPGPISRWRRAAGSPPSTIRRSFAPCSTP